MFENMMGKKALEIKLVKLESRVSWTLGNLIYVISWDNKAVAI